MNEAVTTNQYAQLVTIAERGNEASEIESHLREAGLPVRMTWLQPAKDLTDKLRDIKPDLVFCDQRVLKKHGDCLQACTRTLPYTPVLLLAETFDTDTVTGALRQRARDVVSPNKMAHLHAVYLRELGVSRLRQHLHDSREEIEALEQRLEVLVQASEAAVVQLQDGIIVDANPSFAELVGLNSDEQALGLPFLDFVDDADQQAVKKLISRCAKGRKTEDGLPFKAHRNGGGEIQAELELKLVQFEGEPAVEVLIKTDALPVPQLPAQPAEPPVVEKAAAAEPEPAPLKEEKAEKDPRVSFYRTLENPKHYAPKGSGLSLAYIVVDNSDKLKNDLGLGGADHFLGRIFTFISKQMPGARVYRLASDEFALLAPGKLFKHGESLARNFCKQLSDEIFDYENKSVVLTISVALTLVDEASGSGGRFTEVRELARKLSAGGGNKVAVSQSAKQAEQTEEPVEWQDLRQAISDNRIRLATRPIASLEGDSRHYYEILPRIPGEKGELTAIENGGPQDTNTSMQMELDRKLMQLSLGMLKRFSDNNEQSGVFAPISSCSLERAEETVDWLVKECQRLKVGDQRIILSLSESVLTPHIHRLNEIINRIREQPIRFAINDCEGNEQSLRLIQHLPAHFLRLSEDATRVLCNPKRDKSANLHEAVSIAREHGYKIIAAATGDAHSMAVLWQLGVNYVESGELQEPAAA